MQFMTLEELNTKLEECRCKESEYFLQGLYGSKDDNDKLSLIIRDDGDEKEFEVYYKEQGLKQFSRVFRSEDAACEHFLYEMNERITIRKVKRVKGLEGMTINERLYESGLMDEFDASRRKNKSRAEQILRILKVDENSIKDILD